MKAGISIQVRKISPRARDQIVEARYLMAVGQQAIA